MDEAVNCADNFLGLNIHCFTKYLFKYPGSFLVKFSSFQLLMIGQITKWLIGSFYIFFNSVLDKEKGI